ncbi:hypothetical protein CI109_107070 [Kwoniella shandongensis]|uniref:Uncharacterized protein n=1 Tax=Kwoniella shandongensis TaxID=1734106 RepID=A0A5M6BW42_9TREE|nr:uncharacterized protein CI109_006478 [Kwoniella shandongensis]KAA5525209.1 hypothetical protein CI109_006478 [Kwoniella shandongensis]
MSTSMTTANVSPRVQSILSTSVLPTKCSCRNCISSSDADPLPVAKPLFFAVSTTEGKVIGGYEAHHFRTRVAGKGSAYRELEGVDRVVLCHRKEDEGYHWGTEIKFRQSWSRKEWDECEMKAGAFQLRTLAENLADSTDPSDLETKRRAEERVNKLNRVHRSRYRGYSTQTSTACGTTDELGSSSTAAQPRHPLPDRRPESSL